jgi:predicted methyltransferase
MKSLVPIAFAVLALTACKKEDKDKEQPKTTAPADAAAKPAGDAGPSEAERVAKALAESETKAAEEQKRWTPELTAKAVALRDGKYKDSTAALTAILAGEHRTPGHKDRDPARHPVETLTFFGITPTMTVVELGAGGGWYTELLAPLLAAKGKLIVAGPDTNGPKDKMSSVYGRRLDLFLARSPELYGKVERTTIKPDAIELAPAGSADLVIAMREMHGMVRRGELAKYLAAIHAALKDGGIFGVEQHRAKEGTKGEDTAETGYLAEAWVIEQVTAAGFELVEKSEINANPKDTKDYEKGVWTLPRNYTLGETDKAKYTEIGESDRMTLKFKKVAKK